MTEHIPANKANADFFVSPEVKSSMEKTVFATLVLKKVIPHTPKKLQIAAIPMAWFARILLVVTAVAMELGASVHPLTKTTPKITHARST